MRAGRVQCQRSVGYSRCEPDHQCDPGCPTSTTVCRSPTSAKHVREHLTQLGHPIPRPFLEWRNSMNLVYERCAGLDVHKRNVVVCAIIAGAKGQRSKEWRTFSTMTPDLLLLRDWLKALGITHVAMESTASYWKPIFNV